MKFQVGKIHFMWIIMVLFTHHLHTVCVSTRLENIISSVVDSGSKVYKRDENFARSDSISFLDEKYTPADMIREENYPSETHTVTTEDGYILTVFRIPGPPGSTPIYLQHGLLESSATFLIPGRNKSLAYILSDQGYDVWLGNARGNTFSKKHTNLSTQDPEFWNFSWQELGLYDLPAVISYISQLTNDSLFYLGHSMAATTFSVMAIERPEVAKNVKAMITLAPATYVYHAKGLLKFLSYFWRAFQRIFLALGIYEVFPRNTFNEYVAQHVCKTKVIGNLVCSNILFFIAGYNPEQLDYYLLPKIFSDFPAGTSLKLFTHWLQQMNTNKFSKFDYGPKINLIIYNSVEPPMYDLSKLQVPVAILWTSNDWLVNEEDVQTFYSQIPLKLGIYKIEDERFNHFDFLLAVQAPELVFSKVLQIMADYKNQIIKL